MWRYGHSWDQINHWLLQWQNGKQRFEMRRQHLHQWQSGKYIQLKTCPWFGIVDFFFFMVISQETADNILSKIESMYFSVVKISIAHVLSRGRMLGKKACRESRREHAAGELFSSFCANGTVESSYAWLSSPARGNYRGKRGSLSYPWAIHLRMVPGQAVKTEGWMQRSLAVAWDSGLFFLIQKIASKWMQANESH